MKSADTTSDDRSSLERPLDKIDLRILRALQSDGRIYFAGTGRGVIYTN